MIDLVLLGFYLYVGMHWGNFCISQGNWLLEEVLFWPLGILLYYINLAIRRRNESTCNS